jgi:DHA1 family multidrug resistance protein-like MFS transporter
MWSLLQYRQIRKEVERDWRISRATEPRHSSASYGDTQEILSRLEAGRQSATTHNAPSKVTDTHQTSSDDHGSKDDRIVVECTSKDDPLDPRNWPLRRRARAVIILCLLVFVQTWAGASDSLANTKASKSYHVSQVAENLSTAMYLFGIGTGCLFTGPLSESLGRNPIYMTFSFAYLFFVLGTALSSTFASQIVCRYFVGLASSATLGINGASVNDMFRPVKRALWFPLIAWVNVARKYILHIKASLCERLTCSSPSDCTNRGRLGCFER